jgi:hypothetical protein
MFLGSAGASAMIKVLWGDDWILPTLGGQRRLYDTRRKPRRVFGPFPGPVVSGPAQPFRICLVRSLELHDKFLFSFDSRQQDACKTGAEHHTIGRFFANTIVVSPYSSVVLLKDSSMV